MIDDKGLSVEADLLADSAEDIEGLPVGSDEPGGILKILMKLKDPGGEIGATFTGIVAHGDHHIELLRAKVLDRFGSMMGDIDAGLSHHLDRARVQTVCFYTGAEDLRCITGIIP